MSKKLTVGGINKIVSQPKKTSTSGTANMVKMSSMNKRRKKSYKAYRGQGR